MTEDEMVGWHHHFYGHECEQALGVDDGQGSLPCCSAWGCRVRHDLVNEQQQKMPTSSSSVMYPIKYIFQSTKSYKKMLPSSKSQDKFYSVMLTVLKEHIYLKVS